MVCLLSEKGAAAVALPIHPAAARRLRRPIARAGLPVVERMAEELKTSQHVKGRGAFACDMSALNKVLWGVLTKDPRFSYGCATSTLNDAECSNPLFWRVFSGYPLVSPFKAYVPADSDWHYIAHK